MGPNNGYAFLPFSVSTGQQKYTHVEAVVFEGSLVSKGDLVCDLSRFVTTFSVGGNGTASLRNRNGNNEAQTKL